MAKRRITIVSPKKILESLEEKGEWKRGRNSGDFSKNFAEYLRE